jgi:pentatricopeptide repeat protein
MLAGYAENGDADEALMLFHQMQFAGVMPDSVTTVGMLCAFSNSGAVQQGYVQNGYAAEAIVLFHEMHRADVTPDMITMVSALSACALLGALQWVTLAWWMRDGKTSIA